MADNNLEQQLWAIIDPGCIEDRPGDIVAAVSCMAAELALLRTLIDTPEIRDFAAAVEREAAHQRHRWGDGHDESKTLHDWIAVYVHLMGKMIAADWQGDAEKCAHHIVTVAAVAANMHRLLTARMRALAEAAP